MNTNYLVKAIHKLRPDAQFSFSANDYSTIKWDVIEGTAPTLAEIEIEIEKIKTDEIKQKASKEIEREALLERLGITADEAALLLQ
jgi:hypothetical protein